MSGWVLNTFSACALWCIGPILLIGSALVSEPPDGSAARCFLSASERVWSLADMAWGLVSGATWWFSGPQFLHLENRDDITTFHYYLGVQLGLCIFESRIGNGQLEGAGGSLGVPRS